jgi:hypothetical protein
MKHLRFKSLTSAMVVGVLHVNAFAGLWTPAQIQTVAWYDADDASTIQTNDAAGRVSSILDKSGNGNHAVQTNSARQLYYKLSDTNHNNLGTAGSDANGDYASIETPVLTYSEVFCIADYKAGSDSDFDNYTALLSPLSGLSLTVRGDNLSPDFLIDGNQFNDETYVNGSTNSSASSVLPMASTLFRFKTISPVSVTQATRIWSYDGNPGRSWNGYFGEFIFVNNIDRDTAQQIEGYLAWKWGLEAFLPAEHPYKSSAPRGPDIGTVISLH